MYPTNAAIKCMSIPHKLVCMFKVRISFRLLWKKYTCMYVKLSKFMTKRDNLLNSSLTFLQHRNNMSHRMGKSTICIGENKGADQLRGNCEADHAFVFAILIVQFLFFLNPKFQASKLLL